MRIKNQFIICIGVFSIILLVIAASVANTEQQVAQLNAQEQTARNIERGASSLNSISVDYFLYQEDLQLSKWQTQLSSLSSDLDSLKPSSLQQQTLVNKTTDDLQRLNGLFNDVQSYLQGFARNESIRIDPAFQIRWDSMSGESLSLASDASQLSSSLNDQAHQVNETNIWLTVSLVAAFGALLATIYLMVFRRTLKSVTELQKGIDTIGSGNLEYVIEFKRNDEISELSQSFNKMTTNLKEVTASKTDLEQAQASLRESEQRWATTLASVGDAVIATDTSGKITFMNVEAEKLTGWKLSEASLKPVKEIFSIVNEKTRLEVEDPVSKVLENGLIVGLANHTVLIRKDGTDVPIDDSGAPIKDKDGKTLGVVLIFRDISERKKAEEQLRENEVKFRTVADFTYDWEFWLAPDGSMVYVSPSSKNITGYGASDFVNDPKLLTKIVHPDDKSRITQHFDSISSDGPHELDYRIITATGETRWISHACQPVFDDTGKWIGRRSGNRDVTERKKAEEALASSNQRVSDILESIKDNFYSLDRDWNFIYVNKQAAKLLGKEPESLVGHNIWKLFPQTIESVFETNYRAAMQNREIRRFETRGIQANAWLLVTVFPSGEGISALATDISERKKAEAAILESEERFSKAFHNSPIPQIITRFGDWRYVDANESVLSLLEYSREELLGHTSAELNLIPLDMRDQGLRVVNERGELRDFETAVRTKSGKIIMVLTSTETIMLNGQKHLINTFVDITLRKQMQAKLEEYSKHLEELVEERTKQLKDSERLAAIGATAGMVGHDIRNPLQAITGDVFLAKTELATVPESTEKNNVAESLLEIEKNVDYINKIVADLQDYARPLKPHVEEADLKQIISGLIEKNGLPENVKVTVKVEADSRKVVADSTFISRIMFNLVNNAVQAMPKGGKLTIHAFRDQKTREAVITVKDTGVGIPEAVKDKLFTPMFTTKSKGQGFGLVVIKRMSEALGGSVTFESQEGKGTTFMVRLPPPKN
jgi:PAS domain S-box-containing protein